MAYHFLAQLPHFFQSTCLLCHCRYKSQYSNPNYFGLCDYCYADLPFIDSACKQCGIPLPAEQPLCGECINNPPQFDSTCCAITYEGDIPALIHRFKTQHNNAIRRLLVDLLLRKIQTSHKYVDLIIPSPMHWQRNLKRGNNHAYLLASSLSKQLQLPLSTQLIQRVQTTRSQKHLTAVQRRKNLRHAFQCTQPVNNLCIAVVDDVMTTGSTMNAIATTLKMAGTREVHCWAIARTPKH